MKISTMIRKASSKTASKATRTRKAQGPTELDMGRKVELEHTATIDYLRKHPDAPLQKVVEMIAQDHLKELPDYYTRLKKMEEEGKATREKEGQGEGASRDQIIKFFQENPNPNDNQVHQLAAQLKMSPHDLETQIYALLSSLLS